MSIATLFVLTSKPLMAVQRPAHNGGPDLAETTYLSLDDGKRPNALVLILCVHEKPALRDTTAPARRALAEGFS